MKVNFPVGLTPVAMFLILFTLKLAGPMADTSWWWVTAPLWGPFVMVGVLLALSIIAVGFAAIMLAVIDRFRSRS